MGSKLKLLLYIAIVLSMAVYAVAEAQRLLPGVHSWSWYRGVSLYITAPVKGAAAIGFQPIVRVEVPWSVGMNADFSDLRFAYGEELLGSQVVSYSAGNRAVVDVVLPEEFGAGAWSLGMYYGNPEAHHVFIQYPAAGWVVAPLGTLSVGNVDGVETLGVENAAGGTIFALFVYVPEPCYLNITVNGYIQFGEWKDNSVVRVYRGKLTPWDVDYAKWDFYDYAKQYLLFEISAAEEAQVNIASAGWYTVVARLFYEVGSYRKIAVTRLVLVDAYGNVMYSYGNGFKIVQYLDGNKAVLAPVLFDSRFVSYVFGDAVPRQLVARFEPYIETVACVGSACYVFGYLYRTVTVTVPLTYTTIANVTVTVPASTTITTTVYMPVTTTTVYVTQPPATATVTYTATSTYFTSIVTTTTAYVPTTTAVATPVTSTTTVTTTTEVPSPPGSPTTTITTTTEITTTTVITTTYYTTITQTSPWRATVISPITTVTTTVTTTIPVTTTIVAGVAVPVYATAVLTVANAEASPVTLTTEATFAAENPESVVYFEEPLAIGAHGAEVTRTEYWVVRTVETVTATETVPAALPVTGFVVLAVMLAILAAAIVYLVRRRL